MAFKLIIVHKVVKIMEKSKIVEIVIKVLIYALGLIATALGVSALASCSTSRDVDVVGKAVILTSDTTIVKHGSNFHFKKNFRYE